MKPLWFLAIALVLPAPLMAEEPVPSNDELYAKWQDALEPAGISKELFASYALWAEGQMVIGFCRGWMTASDVVFWRGWWDDSVLAETEVGKKLLADADDLYFQGYQKALRDPPTRNFCTGLIEGWIEDMRAQRDEQRRSDD